MKSRRTFLQSLFAAPLAATVAPAKAESVADIAAIIIEEGKTGVAVIPADPAAVRKLWVAGVAAYEQSEDFFKAFEA